MPTDYQNLLNKRVQIISGTWKYSKGTVTEATSRDLLVTVDDDKTEVVCLPTEVQLLNLHLYKVVLWNDKAQKEQVGIVQAESFYDAENKGKEAAKAWESQGYRYWGTFHEDRKAFNNREVHWL